MKSRIAVFAALLLAASAAASQDPVPKGTPNAQAQREIALLMSFMTGALQSGPYPYGPADTTPRVLNAKPFWTDRAGEFWMYVELASPEDVGRPLSQVVYRFAEAGGGLVAIVYRLPEPSRFANEWRKARPFESLRPSDLVERGGCRMTLQPSMISHYLATIGMACRPEGGEAAYETTEMQVTPDVVRIWTRGFDSKGVQVTGSAVGPLVMKKMPGQAR